MSEKEIEKGVASANELSGRVSVKKLTSGIILVDDSYNASPNSFRRAIEFFEALECGGMKAVVMGDMLELGKYSDESHREIGKLCAEKGIDCLFTVGENSRLAAVEALKGGIANENVRSFSDSRDAGIALARVLKDGDAVLVKGSRMIHLERAIEVILESHCEGK